MMDERTVVTEHHSQVVLSSGADVDQDAGSTGGAEAEDQLLLSQVGLTGNADTGHALHLLKRRSSPFWQEVVTHQGSGLKVPPYIYKTIKTSSIIHFHYTQC